MEEAKKKIRTEGELKVPDDTVTSDSGDSDNDDDYSLASSYDATVDITSKCE